jgi:uncharacterized membrane protein
VTKINGVVVLKTVQLNWMVEHLNLQSAITGKKEVNEKDREQKKEESNKIRRKETDSHTRRRVYLA